jgi:uncharacterized membrane protein YkvA (DUF1232 family)
MNDEYSQQFTEVSFKDKLRGYAKQAGREVVEKSLILYYVGTDPVVPAWAKGIVAAALGYFIVPLDAIPDLAPFVGYADDLGAISMALAAIASCVSQQHVQKAKTKAAEWLGEAKEDKTG